MVLQRVLIIGGGIAGMTCAIETAARGREVYMIEEGPALGGHAHTYCCKATESCNKCSACLVPQTKMQVEKSPHIAIFYETSLIGAVRCGDGFEAVIKNNHGEQILSIDSIILATGFSPFDAASKGEYGYGRNRNVITGLELEKAIREQGSLTAAFGRARNIGFIQCVGSRDLQSGNRYCSKVCCMHAAKMSKLIRTELPDAEISIFYTDIQTFGRGFDQFIETCIRDDQIKFIRGIPSKIFGFPYDRLTVKYANSLTAELCEDKYDLIVLSTAITPGQGSSKLAGILGVELDDFGFFKTDPIKPVLTNIPGVYLAGTCQSPKDILETIQQAKAAVNCALA